MRNSYITRYILLELFSAFIVVLAILTLQLILIVVAGEAAKMNLGLRPTLKLLPFVLPTALAYAVPAALLFAVCLFYGRISADNEVVATKALGISPIALLQPAWLLAFGLSLVDVWLNDVAFSWGTSGVKRVIIQSLEEVAYGMLRTQRSFATSRFSIIVKDVQGRRLIRPIMNFQANNDLPALVVTAVEAELRSNLDRDTMTLVLTDCEIEMDGNVRSVLPGRTVREFPLAYFSSRELRQGSPAEMPLRQIHGEVVLEEQHIQELEQALAASTALALVTGELEDLREDRWQERRSEVEQARKRLSRLRTEPWRRWASGFTALCFTFAGAPLAIMLRKTDVMTTFGRLFGGILVAYYPLFMACCDQAKSGNLPPYVVWIPNLLLSLIGLGLLKFVIRY